MACLVPFFDFFPRWCYAAGLIVTRGGARMPALPVIVQEPAERRRFPLMCADEC